VTLRRDLAALESLYRQLQQQLNDAENRRAGPIRARLDETLKQLKTTRGIGNVAIASPAPVADGRTLDLTDDLIRAVDAQPPLPAGPGGDLAIPP